MAVRETRTFECDRCGVVEDCPHDAIRPRDWRDFVGPYYGLPRSLNLCPTCAPMLDGLMVSLRRQFDAWLAMDDADPPTQS